MSFLKYIVILVALLTATAAAQNTPYPPAGIFTVATADGRTTEFEITDRLKVYTTSESVIVDDNGTSKVFNTDEIKSIGILATDDTGAIDKVWTTGIDRGDWMIVDLKGNVVARGNEGSPDLSNLGKNQIYIVVIGGKAYKYYPL